MGPKRLLSAGLAAGLIAVGVAGCNSDAPVPPSPYAPSATTSATAATAATTTPTTPDKTKPAIDYARLLIQTQDILAADDSYTAKAPSTNPNGVPGAQTLLTNKDQTRAIGVIIVALADPAAAAQTLADATAAIPTTVVGGSPAPAPVGDTATVVSGESPTGDKSVTLLMFTQGNAFARLEFGGLPGTPTPPDFVTDVGQKQAIALRVGLAV
jgi:hypothetical protein